MPKQEHPTRTLMRSLGTDPDKWVGTTGSAPQSDDPYTELNAAIRQQMSDLVERLERAAVFPYSPDASTTRVVVDLCENLQKRTSAPPNLPFPPSPDASLMHMIDELGRLACGELSQERLATMVRFTRDMYAWRGYNNSNWERYAAARRGEARDDKDSPKTTGGDNGKHDLDVNGRVTAALLKEPGRKWTTKSMGAEVHCHPKTLSSCAAWKAYRKSRTKGRSTPQVKTYDTSTLEHLSHVSAKNCNTCNGVVKRPWHCDRCHAYIDQECEECHMDMAHTLGDDLADD